MKKTGLLNTFYKRPPPARLDKQLPDKKRTLNSRSQLNTTCK